MVRAYLLALNVIACARGNADSKCEGRGAKSTERMASQTASQSNFRVRISEKQVLPGVFVRVCTVWPAPAGRNWYEHGPVTIPASSPLLVAKSTR